MGEAHRRAASRRGGPVALKDAWLLDERAEFELYRPWLRPPRVRILMVTDDEGMFTKTHRFGLGEVVEALADEPWWWVRFEVATAHRNGFPVGLTATNRDLAAFPGRPASPGKAALPAKPLHFDFKFWNDPRPELALSNFDEIWLFGIGGLSPALTTQEVDAIRAFMDAKAGVLAMGDHGPLGANLCSEIPRVKHMRKWKGGGPAGNPPPPFGPSRIDTLREGATPGFQFPDQSDDVPQPIFPTRYSSWLNVNVLRRRWYPHPILCGIDGVIDVLPDHMHEGECVVAAPLPGTDFPGGIEPEVIATAEVLAHTTDNSSEGPFGVDVASTARTFGILGAYDGHRPGADVGRIVVDATWHHWVHVNLRGFDPSSAAFAKIRNYYWNVALWLCPPALRASIFDTAVYGLPWLQPFDELRREPQSDLLQLGIEAMDALGRRAGQCMVSEWVDLVFIEFRIPLPFDRPARPFDPEVLQRVGATMLGGMVERAMQLATDAAEAGHSAGRVASALREGARDGLRRSLDLEARCQERRGALLARLSKVARRE